MSQAKEFRRARGVCWALVVAMAGVAGTAAVPRTAAGLETIVLSVVRLRYDNSSTRDNGSAKVRALVDDNDTQGGLELGLVAGTVSVTVTDSGQFDATVLLTGCTATSTTAGTQVRCRSADRRIKAKFYPTAQGPFLYNMVLSVRRLPDTVTGAQQPVGPVMVVLHQGVAIDRPDVIYACQAKNSKKLVCREK